MAPQPPSFLQLQEDLHQIARNFDYQVEQFRERNRHGTGAKELPEDTAEVIWNRMACAALRFITRDMIEGCPAKGTMSQPQARLHLLAHAREIHRRALGTEEFALAHAEVGIRERIVLNEALGDLERAAPAHLRHFFRLNRSRLIIGLLQREMTLVNDFCNRRDNGEFWFPEKLPVAAGASEAEVKEKLAAAAVQSEILPQPTDGAEAAAAGESEIPSSAAGGTVDAAPQSEIAPAVPTGPPPITSKKRPGRHPKLDTDWYRYLDERIEALKTALQGEPDVTREELASILAISRRRLYALDILPGERRARQKKEQQRRQVEEHLSRPIEQLADEVRTLRKRRSKR
jgi:hypothetical protein